MIYLDTSAFIKLYLFEVHSSVVDELIMSQSEPLPVPDLLECECINGIWQKVFRKEIDPGTAQSAIDCFHDRRRLGLYYIPEIDRNATLMTFRDLTVHTQTIGSRTLDILHVAYAVQLKPDIFVTFDGRQRKLARKAGLHVWSPPK